MENYVVSAIKYRPQTFDDVIGQASITRTLENAIKNNHLAQAFLFCGPRGVGKTTCARILARNINEDENSTQDEDFAFNIFELDAASNNRVEDIRSLIDQVRIPPQVGKYKVFIIDEVHMLTAQAFNAFLKTLEEPPPHVIFILATTEKHKILPTILSRCQIFDFRRIEIPDIILQLETVAKKEKIKAEPDALHIVAQKADGAMRDALSIFDQLVSFCGNTLTYSDVIENLNVLDYDYYFRITEAMATADIAKSLVIFDEILEKGFDSHHFVNGLADHFRNLMVCKDPQTIELLQVGKTISDKYRDQSKLLEVDVLLYALKITAKCDVQFKMSHNKRLLVELCLMQLCSVKEAVEKKKA